jgi:hypothetical protein
MCPSAELSLVDEVSELAEDLPDFAVCDPLSDPVLVAVLLLVVSPPVPTALLLFDPLPLPSVVWLELPPLPPVAVLVADPVLLASAVEALLAFFPLLLCEVLSP